MTFTILASLMFSFSSFATTPILADLSVLQAVRVQVLAQDKNLGVGYAQATDTQMRQISKIMHDAGKCGGYEALTSPEEGPKALAALNAQAEKELAYLQARAALPSMNKDQKIADALSKLSAANIKSTVQWLSSFPSRYNKLPDPNKHVAQLEAKLKEMLKNFPGQWSVRQIAHASTKQNTLVARLEGTQRPDEIIVFGGHLDSINMWGGGNAPGADDNASGSASILEALRLVIENGPTERSLEFFWYAGEESGLLGSAEIAKQYKASKKNVIAALQLDMTMFPGSGELNVANIEDYTSAWLRDYLVAMNQTYLNIKLIKDKCGYACSDHASWYKNGFPALMPFEATLNQDNKNIHTESDVIDSQSSFSHALVFSKIALVMAMDLGNSTAKQP